MLRVLVDAGFEAFLVGGGVRDLLLGRRPKDFDVATNALPEQVHELFRRSRLIGRRFRIVHVRVGREVLEVATFRGPPGEEDHPERVTVEGRILRDNVWGTLEEDAWRRDFTVNALYYDARDETVLDYTGGLADLRARQLRLIGDPAVRYREDPVRTLRALRFAAKLGFDIESGTLRPLPEHAELLAEIPPARLFEEVLKLFHAGDALATFELLCSYSVLEWLFPEAAACMEDSPEVGALIRRALANTDTRVREDRPVTPAFLFAALMWGPLRSDVQALIAQGVDEIEAYELAGGDVVAREAQHVALPRRFALVAREIWGMQPRLMQRRGRRTLALLERPRFRAAYDFLLLRAEVGEPVAEFADWWTRVQQADPDAREAMLGEPVKDRATGAKRPRKAGGRGPRGGGGQPETSGAEGNGAPRKRRRRRRRKAQNA